MNKLADLITELQVDRIGNQREITQLEAAKSYFYERLNDYHVQQQARANAALQRPNVVINHNYQNVYRTY